MVIKSNGHEYQWKINKIYNFGFTGINYKKYKRPYIMGFTVDKNPDAYLYFLIDKRICFLFITLFIVKFIVVGTDSNMEGINERKAEVKKDNR